MPQLPPSGMPKPGTEPYTTHLVYSNHSLGYITGLTYKPKDSAKPQCHYFGGIPYALPPIGPYRFRKPRSLPACYRYGTQSNPGNCTGACGVCPQPAYMGPPNEKSWDEDCLQCNVWVPVGKPPPGGWPILFFIHGGWLQHGSPNGTNASALLEETDCQCMIVCPAYRVNVFGFLSSSIMADQGAACDATANFGFWDQRLALEWTWKWGSYFGGNTQQITVGGYSAGAHSAFYQLAYDLRQPAPKRIIKRAIIFSNGPGLQPKALRSRSTQQQFSQLLEALSISAGLTPVEKLDRLRSTSARALVDAAESISMHEFRATTEDGFITSSLFDEIDNGTFSRLLKEAGVQILIGECKDEHHVYGTWRPPKEDTFAAMRTRLCADYTSEAVDAVLDTVYCPRTSSGQRPLPTVQGKRSEDWSDAFGMIYAELQVHCVERGFLRRLHDHNAGDLVRRYRIEWRASSVAMPEEWGVTHGSDLAIWFWGNGRELQEKEKTLLRTWCQPWWCWLQGNGRGDWAAGSKQARRLRSDGSVDTWHDDMWDHGQTVCDTARVAQITAASPIGSKL